MASCLVCQGFILIFHAKNTTIRAVHSGGGGGGGGRGGQRGKLPPPGKLNFFSNIVFEFAELFLGPKSQENRLID